MWKPSERIKYETRCDHWPSASEAQASRLYSSLETKRLSLQSRTWVPAMVPWRSNEAGEVTADVIDWYRRFARGKPGAIVLEATGIRDIQAAHYSESQTTDIFPRSNRLSISCGKRAVERQRFSYSSLISYRLDAARMRRSTSSVF